jgi:DNA-binding MarR family transcriptional regulator
VTTAPTTDELVELAVRLRLAIARTHRQLRLNDTAEMGPTLNSCLATIEKRGPLTHGELAAMERLAPPTITNVIGKLEGHGYVQRTRDPSDGRVSLLEITPAGLDVLHEGRARRTAWLVDRLNELSPAQIRRLVAATDVLEVLAAPLDGKPGDERKGRP